MSIVFDKNEIFKIAEQIERNGTLFYRRAAECNIPPEAKHVLLDIAEMEEKHEKIFNSMKEGDETLNFDPYHESTEYLRALADSNVFKLDDDICDCVTEKETVDDVIEMAIRHEKDSIAFYVGMKDAVIDTSSKKKINLVIEDEMRHIVQLSKKLQQDA